MQVAAAWAVFSVAAMPVRLALAPAAWEAFSVEEQTEDQVFLEVSLASVASLKAATLRQALQPHLVATMQLPAAPARTLVPTLALSLPHLAPRPLLPVLSPAHLLPRLLPPALSQALPLLRPPLPDPSRALPPVLRAARLELLPPATPDLRPPRLAATPSLTLHLRPATPVLALLTLLPPATSRR